jgi:hypothetical protein
MIITTEKRSLIPRDALRIDPEGVARMYRAGYETYDKLPGTEEIRINPSFINDFCKINVNGHNPEDIPNLVISETKKLKEKIGGEPYLSRRGINSDKRPDVVSTEIFDLRIGAWVAGYGIAALRSGDYPTFINALNLVVPEDNRAKKKFLGFFQKRGVALLGIPGIK